MIFPATVFRFSVTCDKFPNDEIGFSEVTGLNQEIQIIEYRHGAMKHQYSEKYPGLLKKENIVLKRAIVKENNEFYAWLSTVNWNTIDRRDISICLLNENHEPIMVWKVAEAFPTKVEGPQLKASGNETAIEAIHLACQRVTIDLK